MKNEKKNEEKLWIHELKEIVKEKKKSEKIFI